MVEFPLVPPWFAIRELPVARAPTLAAGLVCCFNAGLATERYWLFLLTTSAVVELVSALTRHPRPPSPAAPTSEGLGNPYSHPTLRTGIGDLRFP